MRVLPVEPGVKVSAVVPHRTQAHVIPTPAAWYGGLCLIHTSRNSLFMHDALGLRTAKRAKIRGHLTHVSVYS